MRGRMLLIPLLVALGWPASGPTVASDLVAASAQASEPSDDDFAELARRVPGFGGAYVDPGADTVFVWLTDARGDLAEEVKGMLVDLYGEVYALGQVVPLEADYSWHQLVEWRDALWATTLPGHVMSGIDEKRNRLMIGIVDLQRNEAAVADELARMGIPREAVVIRESTPVTQAAEPVRSLSRWTVLLAVVLLLMVVALGVRSRMVRPEPVSDAAEPASQPPHLRARN